jgi:glutamate dehydrogenase/leucine dehydrogenase
VVVQGFGNVGSWTARLLAELGCSVIAVSDVDGGIHAEDGLDLDALVKHLDEGGRLCEYDSAERISHTELLELECDVLVPAALGGTIHGSNAERVNCRVLLEGANAPTTPKADEILEDKGVHVVPDVLANAGGVVVSYFEWVQNQQHLRWSEEDVHEREGRIMARAYEEIAERAERDGVTLRTAAYEQGIGRVVEAARLRGYIHS